jgi:hypothetical protein
MLSVMPLAAQHSLATSYDTTQTAIVQGRTLSAEFAFAEKRPPQLFARGLPSSAEEGRLRDPANDAKLPCPRGRGGVGQSH